MPASKLTRVLLVDGYNVIRSSDYYRNLSPDDFSGGPGYNAARAKLIADVAAFAQGSYEPTVVFDGGGNPESRGDPRQVGGVTVIYSQAGTEADQVIEKLAHRALAKDLEVLVVTSDEATQWTVLHDKVTRMSSAAFVAEIEIVNRSWQERNPSPKVKSTLGERIDAQTLTKLMDWARNGRP
ncbi:MAG: NYN domain-containing protein [Coriobacteriales bacterium]|nr:NYN domain-containing protein [Coriobacteriales bacterium]